MRQYLIISTFLIAGGSVMAAEAPSFDCTKADGTIEELICGDPELAALDRRLAEVYGQSIGVIEGLDDPGDALAAVDQGRNDC